MPKFFTLLLALPVVACLSVAAQENDDKRWKSYIPDIEGTVRAKYEYQPTLGASRFQVRNARVGMTGKLLPIAGYKLEIDLSDEGKVRMLDAYAKLSPFRGWSLSVGQMRVPFTIDAHRSPHAQYFANRSFIAKQVGDVRDVGFTIEYCFGDLPVVLQGGMFNGSGDITEQGQKKWTRNANYSFKAQVFPSKGFNITLSTQKISPLENSIFMHDIGSYVEYAGFHIEAEYLYKHYAGGKYRNVHSFNGFANYDIALKKVFQKVSILCRYDMMTDHWDGTTFDEEGQVATSDAGRHRVTAGVTLSLSKPFVADLRINYEKYFYKKDVVVNESEQDKICIELMLRF